MQATSNCDDDKGFTIDDLLLTILRPLKGLFMCAKWSHRRDVLGIMLTLFFPTIAVCFVVVAMVVADSPVIGIIGLSCIAGIIVIRIARRSSHRKEREDSSGEKNG